MPASAPPKRVLCKYFASGCCKRGDACQFAHDFTAEQSMVCKFYLQGTCTFGDKCRYDHVKPEWSKPKSTPSAPAAQSKGSARAAPGGMVTLSRAGGPDDASNKQSQSASGSATAMAPPAPKKNPWGKPATKPDAGCDQTNDNHSEVYCDAYDYFLVDDNPDEDFNLWRPPEEKEQKPGAGDSEGLVCGVYYESGFCPDGDQCAYVHGDFCEICQKFCLHPSDLGVRVQHLHECRQMHDRLADYNRSATLECGICLEKVLSKSNPSDRRFGLMSCDHVFCLSCIRNWRSNNDGTVDVTSALRTCPICRTPTHFVTPSSIFPDTKAKKTAIVEGYIKKLGEIDCRAFNFGEGHCQFANSCFYRHAYRDGTKAEINLRTAANSDGEFKLVRGQIQLGDLFNTSQARRVVGRRRR